METDSEPKQDIEMAREDTELEEVGDIDAEEAFDGESSEKLSETPDSGTDGVEGTEDAYSEDNVTEEAKGEANTQPADGEALLDSEDEDFGSFDEASVVDIEDLDGEVTTLETSASSQIQFTDDTFADSEKFHQLFDQVIGSIFSDVTDDIAPEDPITQKELLNERSNQIFQELSSTPHLHPPNWTQLKIRHNLLINLGIPINLDEFQLAPERASISVESSSHTRKKSINESDINWEGLVIPKLKDLQIEKEEKEDLLKNTLEILSAIETENLNHSSRQFLELNKENGEILDNKLTLLLENYEKLMKLSSLWQDQLDDVKKNFEIYESVVQNLIGYSQRLKRDEIFENLKKVKSSKSHKRGSFWHKRR